MGRKRTKENRLWILTKGEELLKLTDPKLTKKQVAERMGIPYNAFCTTLRKGMKGIGRSGGTKHEI